MKQLAGYILDYTRELNKTGLLLISLLTTVFIYLNYHFQIEVHLLRVQDPVLRFTGFLLLYFLLFGGSYLVLYLTRKSLSASPLFMALLVLAPATFAWRMSSRLITSPLTNFLSAPWNRYWAIILNAPLKCVLMLMVIFVVRKAGAYRQSITGLGKGNISLSPFFILLLLFVPVMVIAALQPDFGISYPRASKVAFIADHSSQPWLTVLIFEISYAFDFVAAEVFFRGFLVLAFLRFAGPSAILPMAAFYCAIHFGKPLVECISSFVGAIMLGVISYRTGSVWGGLLLHLGIGMFMELAGFVLR
ncbi:CPBP family intramembrane glutamic endopeptidase [Flavitalea antarctica]